jgi:hypothetical protein
MKRLTRKIKKIYQSADISPFSYSRVKVIIYLIWGFNALVFLSRDSIVDNNACIEQLSIVSREFFDNNITLDPAGALDINIIPYVAGVITEPGSNIYRPAVHTFHTGRAPPAVS